MARKQLTPAQIRDRKAKRLAIGLSLVFLAVLGIQGPTLLKAIQGSSGGSASSTTSASSVPGATTTAGGATTISAGVVGTPGAVGVVAAAGPSGQLAVLSAFPIKDPFHAQVGASPLPGATAPTGTTTTGSTTPGSTTPGSTMPGSTTPKSATPTTSATTTTTPLGVGGPTVPTTSVPFTTTTPTTPAAPAVPPNAAQIMLNGKRMVVPVGKAFPSAAPLFKLVSLQARKGTIRIAVDGGSFTNGIPLLLLRRGTEFTLANESDGSRYVVKLVELTTAAVAPASTAPAAPVLGGTTTAG